jgi:tetratricopeptide (TPR) repeat protein
MVASRLSLALVFVPLIGCSRFDAVRAEAAFDRGNAAVSTKDDDRAIENFTQAIRLNPEFAYAYNNRGNVYSRKKAYDQAIADYTEAIRLNPKSGDTYQNRAGAYLHTKDYDKAIEDFTEAIRLYPRKVRFYSGRAFVFANKKEYGKAVDDLVAAIRLEPEGSVAYNDLAWLQCTCPDDSFRDGKTAVKNATKACELVDWKNANYLGTLAAAKAEVGNFKDAVKWEKWAIYLDYGDKEATEKARQRLKLYRDGKPYRED